MEPALNEDLLARARAGDGEAFAEVVAPFRRELELHCYRLLGSHQDAEDVMQNTLLSAWQALPGYEGRSSLRTWLYRVATSRCLDARRAARRRPDAAWPVPEIEPVEPTRLSEVVWLEPYPDSLLEGGSGGSGPEARYEARETISLAFILALQVLPSRQRAALILRDVLGFPAREVAEMLDASEEAVSSALRRARAALARHLAGSPNADPPPRPDSPTERAVLARLTAAYEQGDVDTLVELLTDEVWVRMPPVALEYRGRENADWFLRTIVFRNRRTFRLVPTRANGQPAYGLYLRDRNSAVVHATGLLVVTLAGERISAITRFDKDVLARFGLPRTLPA
jgi:RNA polymerase sigma-70 factor (TIGR02960 family)